MSAKACSRCKEREAGERHAWCRECQAEYRKERRAVGQVGVQLGVSNGANDVQRDVQRPAKCPTCPTLRKEIEALTAEVGSLKKALAAKEAMPSVPEHGISVTRASVSGAGIGTGAQSKKNGPVMVHTAMCQCIACRGARVGRATDEA